LVWLLDRLLPRLSPDTRCWLWRLACLKLLLVLAWFAPAQSPWALPLLPGVSAASSPERMGEGENGRRGEPVRSSSSPIRPFSPSPILSSPIRPFSHSPLPGPP